MNLIVIVAATVLAQTAPPAPNQSQTDSAGMIACVRPDMTTYKAQACASGDKAGLVCKTADEKLEFVASTIDAMDGCRENGGHVQYPESPSN